MLQPDERLADLEAHLLRFRGARGKRYQNLDRAIFRGRESAYNPGEIRFVFRSCIVRRNAKL